MKAIFLLFPLIYLGGNAYLFWKSFQAMSSLPIWVKCILSVFFWIAAFSLFISTGLRDSACPYMMIRSLYKLGSVWLAFLLYMVLALAAMDIARVFVPSFANTFPYALALVAVILVCGNINYHKPVVEHLDMAIEKETANDCVRIVAVSDIHIGLGTGPEKLRKYIDLINSQTPDLVVIAGDLIDNSVRPLIGRPFDRELARIAAPVYMVPGNHEYISGINECAEYLSKTGVHLLRDSIVTIPEGIQIIGRDDRSNPERLSLETLLSRTDNSKPVIVLDHQPYGLAQSDSLKVDIQISGHTHAGQIWPLTQAIGMMYEQPHGYRKWNHSHIWVSSGLSLWGPPFRIGSRSDMAVITIKASE